MDRSDSRKKPLAERFRRWIRRKKRERAIRREEKAIAKKLAAKARARELRELEKSAPSTDPIVPPPFPVQQPKTHDKVESVKQDQNQASPPVSPPLSVPLTGIGDYLKRYLKVRKAQVLQQRLAREARKIEASKGRERAKKSAFGVGSTDQSASDVRIPYRQRPIYFIKKYVRQAIRYRVPHWIAAMSPAVLFGFGVAMPSIIQSKEHAAASFARYQDAWTDAVHGNRTKEASLIGDRIISSPLADSRDLLSYFDTLVANGDYQKAVRLLIARESDQRDLVIAEYRFDVAERFVTMLEGSSELADLALKKFAESLNGPLSKEKEIRARKVLANAAAVRGDLASAMAILLPIRNADLVSRCDILWLSWNIDSGDPTAQLVKDAEDALQQIEGRMAQNPLIDEQEIAARARLSSLLRKDDEFLAWLEANSRIDAEGKARWKREFENLTLVREVRSVPLNPDAAWNRLTVILDREPNNPELIDMAIGLAIATPDRTSQKARNWVLTRIRAATVDPQILARTAMAAHAAGQWPLAIECYERLIAVPTNDPGVFNNLAALYYKFPPYRYEEASKLIDRALAEAPDNLNFIETKGQILARLGRVDEAKTLLERCLATFPNEWNLHNTMAQIYEYLDDKELGAVHREKLATLKKPANAPEEDRITFASKPKEPEPDSKSGDK